MMLKTKRNIGIINAITMLVVNVIYMIAVAVNGMSFIAFAGFEVPIDANLMVLLYLFSLILKTANKGLLFRAKRDRPLNFRTRLNLLV